MALEALLSRGGVRVLEGESQGRVEAPLPRGPRLLGEVHLVRDVGQAGVAQPQPAGGGGSELKGLAESVEKARGKWD